MTADAKLIKNNQKVCPIKKKLTNFAIAFEHLCFFSKAHSSIG